MGAVTGAGGVVFHRLLDALVTGFAWAVLCVKVGLADNPIEAKISSSGGGAGGFFGGAVTGFFCPRLVIWRGAPPFEFGSGIKFAVDGAPADTGAGACDPCNLLIGVAFLSDSPETADFGMGG
jgi:hypothetical protein